MNELVAICRKNYETVRHLPMPDGLELNPAWDAYRKGMAQAIARLESPADAIGFAQVGSNSGFDHRIRKSRQAEVVANYKLDSLKHEFGGSIIGEPWFREHELSIEASLVSIDDLTLSTIFLTHAYYFLRIRAVVGGVPRRVVEIGSGYGGLARIFGSAEPTISYTLVDIPESLFFAETFLRSHFRNARFTYLTSADGVIPTEPGFTFVPIQNRGALRGAECDLVVNTGSFQEMTEEWHRSWMMLMEQPDGLRTRFLYSFNYFLVNRRRHRELGLGTATPICPILDTNWTCRYFDINPLPASVDARTRNWLDVLLEREINHNPAAAATREAKIASRYPMATVPWLRHMWMAIWYSPDKAHIARMLTGLRLVREGKALTISNQRRRKNFCDGRLFQALSATLPRSSFADISSLPPEDIALDRGTNRIYEPRMPALQQWKSLVRHYVKTITTLMRAEVDKEYDISKYSEIEYYRRRLNGDS